MSGGNGPSVWRCDDVSVPQIPNPKDPTTKISIPNWVNISGNLPGGISVNAIALGPRDSEQQIFIGTDTGVYVTNDGGNLWKDAGIGLGFPANVRVSALNYVASRAC